MKYNDLMKKYMELGFVFPNSNLSLNEFKKLFTGKNYYLVQLFDIHNYGTEDNPIITGFAGTFKWVDDVLVALDGDSYDDDMVVVGYQEFVNNNEPALNILVEEW